MQINKNDILNGISRITGRNNGSDLGSEGGSSKVKENGKTQPENKLSVDVMRNRVLNLQHEVKDIQTNLSGYQAQRAFLQELDSGAEWKAQLQKFTKQPVENLEKVPTLDHYLSRLENEIGKLNKEVFTREVTLENIISAGMGERTSSDTSQAIIRDMEQAKTIFSRIRQDAVGKLIN